MTKEQINIEKNRVEAAMAIYAAEPEFNTRIAVEFMGWSPIQTGETTLPDGRVVPAFLWLDSGGRQVAEQAWSPMTDMNHAMEVVKSPRWRTQWPNSVICMGPNHNSDVIVVWEKPDGSLEQLARAPRASTAVCLAAIRSLPKPDISQN